jgi:hypothetical protein
MIGLVASTLSFFLVEDCSRKRLIPCFFPGSDAFEELFGTGAAL